MATVAIITVCTILCIAVGIPIGILMARSNRVERAMLPVLDMMQTIPSFVYLIPILMLLGIGKIPGLIAVCIYAIPPVIRLTNLGIREVDKETIEASEAFGATKIQKLRTVQIPLALPTVFAGVNQTIMMALAMVVIASMIGVKGLGVPILMLLGIGKIPGLIAVCIYAIPPVIRLTNLGIREVDKETIEASEAFGATKLQKLKTVQIPLALPTVFAGVNQTIMMALAMVVIASMIGVKGLGVPILRAISNQYLALGLFNGLAIVAIAIIFDRISQEYGRRIQKHRGIKR